MRYTDGTFSFVDMLTTRAAATIAFDSNIIGDDCFVNFICFRNDANVYIPVFSLVPFFYA